MNRLWGGEGRRERLFHLQGEDRHLLPSVGGCCPGAGAGAVPAAGPQHVREPDRDRVHGAEQGCPEAVAPLARSGGRLVRPLRFHHVPDPQGRNP